MEANTISQKDHDSIVTLVSDVKNIKEGQDKFHIDQEKFRNEVKDNFADLKDNYADRMTKIESRLETNEKEISSYAIVKKIVYAAVSIILIAVLTALVYLVVKH